MSAELLDKIRPAVESDVPSLARIDAHTSINPWSEARHCAACRGEGTERVRVVDGDQDMEGFVVYSVVADEASIHNVAVEPVYQGRGIGRALMQAALDDLAREGIRHCFLEVRESNTAARHLYLALGFTEDGRRKNYYRVENGREDALMMSLAL